MKMEGCTTLEEKLKAVSGIIFNNWFALKLALDHGQGGPPGVQNVKIHNLLDSVASMIMSLSNISDCDDIGDYISDVMNDEFDIVLEDNSEVQVVKEIFDLYTLLKSGNDVEVMNRIGNLPVKTSILTYSVSRVALKESQMESSSSEDEDCEEESSACVNENFDMEQDDPDPGWTVVKHNKRK